MVEGKKKLIGITMGDPAGIGSEIAVKALENNKFYEECIPLVVGDRVAIEDAIGFTNSKLKVNVVKKPAEAMDKKGTINVLDMNMLSPGDWTYGQVGKLPGKAAVSYIEKAIELAMNDELAAVVTGPIHKRSINMAGCPHAGHTEIFAENTGCKDYAMMLADDSLRVVHVSTHVPLRVACDRVKKDRVGAVIKLTYDAMKKLGISEPRIAVAGLNPHAGEESLFGEEDTKEIAPAIEEAVLQGMMVEGPIAPDTVFAKAVGGQYDAVVVMYHDQGHIPMKTLGFKLDNKTGKWNAVSGVNVTLGLPIIRTSVDHGTAFGKAGKGTANSESMEEAIEMAIQMSKN